MTDPRSVRAAVEFRRRLAALDAELLEAEWLGSRRPHSVRCSQGHACSPRPTNVAKGQGICRTCIGENPLETWAAFCARVAELGATLVDGDFRGTQIPYRIRCDSGHIWAPRPHDKATKMRGCPTCRGWAFGAAEAPFRARLAELGATLLEPRYLGSVAPHRVRCASGHESSPRPLTVVQGAQYVCRECYQATRSGPAEAAFRARVAELGGTVLEPEWLGVFAPHRVRCGQGHEVTPTPSNVRDGGVCRICRGKAWNAFYVVRNEGGFRVKFGITSTPARTRLRDHARRGYTSVVRVAEGLPGSTAPDAERAVLSALKLAGEKPVEGREYFDISCLAVICDVADSHVAPAASIPERHGRKP